MDHHTYTVSGMTCAHCVMSVTEEITALAVTSERPLDAEQVRAAVEEAGYALVG